MSSSSEFDLDSTTIIEKLVDPHWAYEPPKGAVLLDHTVDVGAFEWDAIKDDDDTEIWLIRVPDSIKSKHLKGLEIDPPPSSRTARIGSLARKEVSYDVWSMGDDDAEDGAGEELQGLSCLLPRKRKDGRLYIAPKRVSHCIVISAQPSSTTEQAVVYQNPPRQSYPKALFKHSFVPYGARCQPSEFKDMPMVTDDVEPTQAKPDKPATAKDSKGKKRKGEGDTSKHSKKHKTHA